MGIKELQLDFLFSPPAVLLKRVIEELCFCVTFYSPVTYNLLVLMVFLTCWCVVISVE